MKYVLDNVFFCYIIFKKVKIILKFYVLILFIGILLMLYVYVICNLESIG